jgi:hypothetical protein
MGWAGRICARASSGLIGMTPTFFQVTSIRRCPLPHVIDQRSAATSAIPSACCGKQARKLPPAWKRGPTLQVSQEVPVREAAHRCRQAGGVAFEREVRKQGRKRRERALSHAVARPRSTVHFQDLQRRDMRKRREAVLFGKDVRSCAAAGRVARHLEFTADRKLRHSTA